MAAPTELNIRELGGRDLEWAEWQIVTAFGSRAQARLGTLVDPLDGPGLVAEAEGKRLGLITFADTLNEVEIVAIAATEPRQGVGSALIHRAVARAEDRRLWLVTTNDNLDALRFYQRRGFRITAVRPGAVDWSRDHLKPSMPEVGSFGIPLRDELVLDYQPTV